MHKNKKNKIKFSKILQSILAGLLGIQSQKNMVKDFNYNRPSVYIISGIIAVFILVIILISIVKIVI